jgi:gliding motility-associated-like protein
MKNIKLLATITCCLFLLTAKAQKEGNIWHFGQGAALDFNSGTATISTPSSMWSFEGSASIADANGNLLFYSNGGGRDPILSGQSSGKIWNRNHEVMYDMGNTEGGGFSSAQSSVIVPRPGVANHYLLFTMEEIEFNVGGSVPGQPQGRGLSYFDVDMSLNGGLGGVASYTGLALVPSYEGLCAIRHANGSDYWILAHNDTFGLAVFPVNTLGVGTPLFYNTPDGTGGMIKASPDGKWLTCTGDFGQTIYQFDPSSGLISNPLLLNTSLNYVEFSPNSKRLFGIASNNSALYFDLTSANINASQTNVGTLSNIGIINGQMQLAPDGKIYFIQASFIDNTVFLSTIVCPNTAPFIELKKFDYTMPGGNSFFGLPNFDNAIFRRDIDPPLPVDLGADQTLCENQSVVLNAGVNNASYVWSNGSTFQTLTALSAGTYTVTVTAPGCGIGVDSVVIKQVVLNLEAGSDQSLCAGSTVLLEASGNGTLTWSPAAAVSNPDIATPFFVGDSSIVLVLTASLDGCSAQDSFEVSVLPIPMLSVVPTDSTILAGSSVQLIGTGTGTISWTPTDGLSCTNCLDPVATPTETTVYTMVVTNAAGCSASASVTVTVTPPDCTPDFPNAFTPNGDAANDQFKPIGDAIESFDLSVYNRWGQKVYKGNSAWDGRLNDLDAPSDVYIYTVDVKICGSVLSRTGDVTLLR